MPTTKTTTHPLLTFTRPATATTPTDTELLDWLRTADPMAAATVTETLRYLVRARGADPARPLPAPAAVSALDQIGRCRAAKAQLERERRADLTAAGDQPSRLRRYFTRLHDLERALGLVLMLASLAP